MTREGEEVGNHVLYSTVLVCLKLKLSVRKIVPLHKSYRTCKIKYVPSHLIMSWRKYATIFELLKPYLNNWSIKYMTWASCGDLGSLASFSSMLRAFLAGTGQQENVWWAAIKNQEDKHSQGSHKKYLITVKIALLRFSSLLCSTIIGSLTSKTVVVKGNPGNIYSLNAVLICFHRGVCQSSCLQEAILPCGFQLL